MRFIILLFFIVFLAFPTSVSAHGAGLVPFFKVNGELAPAHPMQKDNIIPAKFVVPQDLPEEKLVVNQPIDFLIDTELLSQVYAKDILDTIIYTWDYGNGDKASGTQNTYTYKKVGSYTLTIYAEFKDAGVAPQPIETVQINVLPNKEYVLPEPIIKVNREVVGSTPIKANLNRSVSFEAEIINEPTSDDISYDWDLGEGATGKGQKLVHTYDSSLYLVPTVLKVTDKNGLIVYTFGLVANTQVGSGGVTLPIDTWGMGILIAQGVVVLVAAIWFYSIMRRKHK